MKTFEFTLVFELPQTTIREDSLADCLFEAGCDDAIIGVGNKNVVSIDFARDEVSAADAVHSALSAITAAIEGIQLVEVKPDLVTVSEIAELVGCSRQNIRKYVEGEIKLVEMRFPPPAHIGFTSLWHLHLVAKWLSDHTELNIPGEITEASQVACEINAGIARETCRRHTSIKPQDWYTATPVNHGHQFSPTSARTQESRVVALRRFRAIPEHRALTQSEREFRPGFYSIR